MNSNTVVSTIQAMLHQEETGYSCPEQIHQMLYVTTAALDNKLVDNNCRRSVVDFCYQIADYCNFDRETIAITFSFVDRFVVTEAGSDALKDRTTFMLTSMTALYIAMKIHESQAVDPHTISAMCPTYTAEQVESTELQILHALKWRLNPPTALAFVRQFLKILPPSAMDSTTKETVYDLAKFQTELAVRDCRFLSLNASSIGFACIMNSLESMCVDHAKYTYIGNYIVTTAKIDYHSQTFIGAKKHLYESLYNYLIDQPDLCAEENIPFHHTNKTDGKRADCDASSSEASPRSLITPM